MAPPNPDVAHHGPGANSDIACNLATSVRRSLMESGRPPSESSGGCHGAGGLAAGDLRSEPLQAPAGLTSEGVQQAIVKPVLAVLPELETMR